MASYEMLFTENQILKHLNLNFSRPIKNWNETRKDIKRLVDIFIDSFKIDNPEYHLHNFVVVCDDRNNPPDDVNANRINIDVWIQEKKENMWEHLPIQF